MGASNSPGIVGWKCEKYAWPPAAAVEGEGAATAGEAVGAGEAAGVGFEASDLLYLAALALL